MTPFITPAIAPALAIVAYIVHSLWQGALIAALAALVMRLFPRSNATTRYAVWYIALLAVVVIPAFTVAMMTSAPRLLADSLQHASTSALSASPERTATTATAISAPQEFAAPHRHAANAAHRADPASASAPPRQRALPQPSAPRRLSILLPQTLTLIVAAIWILGAFFGLLRIALGYAALAKLQRDALPLPPGYREAMPLWTASCGTEHREMRLCVSPDVEVPVAIGLFDGMILMPDHLLHSFDQADIDRFSVHELAHLQRHDDWTCTVERIACAILFFNPVMRLLARQLDLEREVACDDWVVTRTREAHPYAVGLARMAEATPWPHRPIPTPAIFVTRKSLSIRVERLLNKRRDVRPKLAGGAAAACGLALAVAACVLLPVAPVVGSAIAPGPDVVVPTTAAAAVAPRAHLANAAGAHHTSRAGTSAVAKTAAARAYAIDSDRYARTSRRFAADAARYSAAIAESAAPSARLAKTAARSLAATARSTVSTTARSTTAAARLATVAADIAPRAAAAATSGADARPAPRAIFIVVPQLPPALVKTPVLAPRAFAAVHASAIAAAAARAPFLAVVAESPGSGHVDYLDALSAAGYGKLSADQIVALHDSGVSTHLLAAAGRYFNPHATVEELIALSNAGLSGTFLDDLGRRGVKCSPKDALTYAQTAVSASYIADVLHAFPAFSPATIVELSQHGVSARAVAGLRTRGYDIGPSDLMEFTDHGVSLGYVDKVNAHRSTRLSLREIITLHDHGVSSDVP